MSKRQLNHLFMFFLFFVFLSTGCAHRPVTPSLAVSEDIQLDQNRQITSDGAEQISQAPDMVDNSNHNIFDEKFEEDKVQVADPLSLWNKAMFHFNDKLYFWALKPLARGYKAVAPDFFRAV